MYKAAVFASLAASAASAAAYELLPAHAALKRDLLAARQTAVDYSSVLSAEMACETALMSIYDTVPSMPPAVLSWEATQTQTDPCSITFPASISSDLASYESAALDWYSSHSAALDSALSLCPQYSESALASADDYTSAFASYSDICGAAGGGAVTTDAGATTTATTTGDKTTDATGKTTTADKTTAAGKTAAATTATAATTPASTNAGPRETAAGLAAMAVVGVLGAVAAL